jgi:hypothetical protein
MAMGKRTRDRQPTHLGGDDELPDRRLAHKAEHAVALDTGAIVGVTVQDADEGDRWLYPFLSNRGLLWHLISAGDGKIVGYFEHPTEISSYLYWYPEDVRDRTLVSEQGFNALGIAGASTARAWITSRSRSWPAIRLDGGGFVVLNGMTFDEDGTIRELDTPFPGCNLFSPASGGAIHVRDPRQRVGDDQLNGGMFVPLTAADWAVVQPYLEGNARWFGIPIERLLDVDGRPAPPEAVYRKVAPAGHLALAPEEGCGSAVTERPVEPAIRTRA